MFGFIKKAIKAVSKVAKPLVPAGKFAALLVPGGSQVMAGVQVADTLVKAANGKPDHKLVKGKAVLVTDPRELAARKQKALGIIKTTQLVAANGKTPAIRRAAAKGLTLMNKRAAALRFTGRNFKISPRGVVVKVA